MALYIEDRVEEKNYEQLWFILMILLYFLLMTSTSELTVSKQTVLSCIQKLCHTQVEACSSDLTCQNQLSDFRVCYEYNLRINQNFPFDECEGKGN